MTPETIDTRLHTFDTRLHTFRSPTLQGTVREAIGFLNSTPLHLLPPVTRFDGVGVYALYYLGDLELYEHIARRNRKECTQPIYVGKAVPTGWRTARSSQSASARQLYGRLREHYRSIAQGEEIHVEDFRCRFIILEGIETDLIGSVEAQLIREYRPLWNAVIDGFGNHDPGSGRYDPAPSEWDVLHPGRPWMEKLTGNPLNLSDIRAKIRQAKFA
jgi:hypothetical protein